MFITIKFLTFRKLEKNYSFTLCAPTSIITSMSLISSSELKKLLFFYIHNLLDELKKNFSTQIDND